MEEKPAGGSSTKRRFFYAIRTTVGQEYNIALILENRVRGLKIPIFSILVVDGLKGFVFLEAASPAHVDAVISGLKYVKGRVPGTMKYEDLEKFIKPVPVIEEIDVDDIVEVVRGPLRGMRGKVVRVNKAKREVVIELFEAAYPLPTTVDADDLRILEKASKGTQA
ncbi:MAG: transcription elongation factor Spt5 [Thermoprotei archaeon]|nr:MAG: transcription elongation factor Spt5 [Thermoprotei archaeon]